ncbi:MAG: hypothetical protein MUF71_03340 [Candidatus Kapabacteria bacterium]|jgi:hypothetical protein|nr:hypothetical protein [Candidatus Kapabacteria bacterium]
MTLFKQHSWSVQQQRQSIGFKRFFVLFCTVILLGCGGNVLAQSFRFGGGISAPFDQIVAVRFALPQGGVFVYPVPQGQNLGYHIAGRYLLSLEKGRGFTLSAGIHQFETPIFSVYDPSLPQSATSVKVSQTFIPLGLGFEYRFLSLLILHAYIAGEGSYNLMVLQNDNVQPTSGLQSIQTTLGRVGASAALGVEATIFGLGADISVRYHWANLLLREANELNRTFVSLNVSLVLGEK